MEYLQFPTDIQKSLSEVKRVLKPGGKFLFFEHGLSESPELAKWQTRITPYWSIIGDGCRLNVDMEKEIQKVGFTLEKLDKFYLNNAPRLIAYVFKGVATKS